MHFHTPINALVCILQTANNLTCASLLKLVFFTFYWWDWPVNHWQAKWKITILIPQNLIQFKKKIIKIRGNTYKNITPYPIDFLQIYEKGKTKILLWYKYSDPWILLLGAFQILVIIFEMFLYWLWQETAHGWGNRSRSNMKRCDELKPSPEH